MDDQTNFREIKENIYKVEKKFKTIVKGSRYRTVSTFIFLNKIEILYIACTQPVKNYIMCQNVRRKTNVIKIEKSVVLIIYDNKESGMYTNK